MIPIPKNPSAHITPIQIRFNDIDIAAHVNNATYQEYFDLAKTHFFEQLFEQIIDWKIKGLVLAHIEIDYYQPTYLEEPIVVESTITKVGTKSFKLTQLIRKANTKGNEDIKCISESIMVAYHYQKAYSFNLPEQWVEKIEKVIR